MTLILPEIKGMNEIIVTGGGGDIDLFLAKL